jgi:aspartate-semialdehyde dehydrogenase
MDELFQQTKGIFSNNEIEPKIFQKQIAFNVIPQIGAFDDNGYSEEENKMINETKKILSSEIEVTATCVRVPTFIGHAESVNVEFDKPISIENAIEVLKKSPGCEVQNYKENNYTTPIDCVGDNMTFISRIRKDESVDNALNLWIVSDNLRKGAALNTVQISEILIREYLT